MSIRTIYTRGMKTGVSAFSCNISTWFFFFLSIYHLLEKFADTIINWLTAIDYLFTDDDKYVLIVVIIQDSRLLFHDFHDFHVECNMWSRMCLSLRVTYNQLLILIGCVLFRFLNCIFVLSLLFVFKFCLLWVVELFSIYEFKAWCIEKHINKI